MDRNELENQILQDPDNFEPYMVYADWLQEQGDPLGELIVRGNQLYQNKTVEMTKKLEEVFEPKRSEILGDFDAYLDMVEAWEWRFGLVDKLNIRQSRERSGLWEKSELERVEVDVALEALLSRPVGRFLRNLTVGIVDYEENNYNGIIGALQKEPRPFLRSLILGDFGCEETELNWSDIGNASELWSALPNLETLYLRSGGMEVGPINLPKLKELYTITGGMSGASLSRICEADWPALSTMMLQIGSPSWDSDADIDDMDALWSGERLPVLKHLGLMNVSFSDSICRRLGESALADRIETLDLSLGTLGDDGVYELVQAKKQKRFGNLKQINVERNYLTEEGQASLRELCDNVIIGDQEDDGGDADGRYISAGE